jgi:hypothetical protein
MPPDRGPHPLTGLLHLAALWNIAIAQPVFDILGRSPEFFVAYAARAANIWGFVILVSVAMPVALWGVVRALSRLVPTVGTAAMAVSCGSLLLPIALYAVKQASGAGAGISFVIAGTCAAAGAVGYARYTTVRLFITLLAPAVILVPATFLFQPPVARLLDTGGREPLPAVEVATTPPIVMVVFDELPLVSLLDRDGRIDAARFPNFDALRQDATWFRNASAVGEFTTEGFPPIITGTLPVAGRLPVADDYPANLFTLLAPHYRMHVVEPLTELCPDDLCVDDRPGPVRWLASVLPDVGVVYLHTILPDGMTRDLPPVTQNWRDFVSIESWEDDWRGNADRPASVESFIEQIGAESGSGRPPFHFLHVVLPHEPWVYLPTGQRFSDTGTVAGFGNGHGEWVDDKAAVAFEYQRHLLQVGLVDTLLGRLVARLREVGLYEEALIVVAADHGASFRPGESFRHPTQASFADIASIPLFIKRPRQQEGDVIAENVWSLDVPATVAAALGVTLPWKSDSVNVFDGAPAARDGKVLFYDGGKQSIAGPSDLGASLLEAAAWRHELLPSGDPYQQPRLGRADELVGQRLERFAIQSGNREVTIDTLPELGAVNPEAGFIPSRIAGSLVVEGSEPPTLAIAVNGVVAATTVPYTFPVAGRRNLWEVIVDPRSFARGANSVDVVEVRQARDGTTVLYTTRTADSEAARLNVSSERARWLLGVSASGLYATEWAGTQPFRWSNGNARLSIPVDAAAPPSELSVTIAMAANPDTVMTIAVDDCVLFEGVIQGAWSRTFPLRGCNIASERMEVSIRSTARPPANGDPRSLGVAIASVETAP